MNKRYLTALASLFYLTILLFAAGCQERQNKEEQAKPVNNAQAPTKVKWHRGAGKKQNEDAGYAQVVKAGNILYISGIPTSDLSAKGISELYKSLGECLKAFGASPENVVKETLYTTDIEAMKEHNDARKAFYRGDFPAASWVQVSRLYEREAKVEVDLVAHIPEKQ